MKIVSTLAAFAALFLAGSAIAADTVIQHCPTSDCEFERSATGPFLDIVVVDDADFSTFTNQEIVEGVLADFDGHRVSMFFDDAEVDFDATTDIEGYPTDVTGVAYSCVNTLGTNYQCQFTDADNSDGNDVTVDLDPADPETQINWEVQITSTDTFTITGANALEFIFDDNANHVMNDMPNIEVGYVDSTDAGDDDGDGYQNVFDNCDDVDNGPNDNAYQLDTDLDGYGNACDADYDGDGLVTTTDFGVFLAAYQGTTPDIDTDHDGDGDTDLADYSIFLSYFNGSGAVGSSGLSCADPDPANGPCTPQDL